MPTSRRRLALAAGLVAAGVLGSGVVAAGAATPGPSVTAEQPSADETESKAEREAAKAERKAEQAERKGAGARKAPVTGPAFVCDPSLSHGQNVSAYARSLPEGPGRGRLVSQAARSDCGKDR